MRLGLSSILVASLLAIGCASERASPECKEVCRKQARCVEQKGEAAANGALPGAVEQNKFDQSECIAVCTALRRDAEGEKLVEQHVACVTRAKEDCAALLACP